MRDEQKTKAQPINELAELHQRVAELQQSVPAGEASEAERVWAECILYLSVFILI